jgi:hypothetical protein
MAGQVATAAMVVLAVIDTTEPVKHRDFDLAQQPSLDSIQSALAASLELLESAVFPFASGLGLKYLMVEHQRRYFRSHDCLFLQRP